MTERETTDRLPSLKLRNFRLLSVLGRGGMGTVYLGEQLHPLRKVAIKIIEPQPDLPPAILDFLKHEGDTAAQFDHENLVHVYECGIVDDHYYLAMQLLPGGDLENRLGKGLGRSEIMRVIRALAAALAHIHQRGYIHRDVKPSNVLFSDSDKPVLVDFGIAKVAGKSSELTDAGLSTGTPTYMSPEQIRGMEVDPRSDLYSLGVLLFEMLVGQPPFSGATARDVQTAHLRDPPPRLPEDSQAFQPILDRLLAKDPAERYADCGELLGALAALEHHQRHVITTAVTPRLETPPAQTSRARARAGRWALAGVAVLSLGVALWWQWDSGQGDRLAREPSVPIPGSASQSEAKQRPSIAVLPLANRSSDDDAEFFTDGIHDEILTQLAQIGSLKVVSRTSVMRYRDSDKSLHQVATELGVDTVLEGSVQRAGEQVRINVQLIDAVADEHLWAQSFDRELTAGNLFAIQSEIARSIATALQATLSAEESERLARAPTDNLSAYQAYLLGRHYFHSRVEGRETALKSAIEQFERALELEPGYADALAGLASVYGVYYGYTSGSAEGLRTRALDYAAQALSADPSLAMPHAVLGHLSAHALDRERHLLRAIELEPSNSTSRLWLGIAYAEAGRLDLAEQRLLEARDFDPSSSVVIQWLAVIADLRGHREAAFDYARQGMAMGLPPAMGLMSVMHYRAGELELAEEMMNRGIPPNELQGWLDQVMPAARDDSLRAAAIQTIIGPYGGKGMSHLRILYLSALGADEQAYDIIEADLVNGSESFVYVWRADDDSLRRHARFKPLARQLGLPAYWREKGFPEGCVGVGVDDFECR